MFIRISDTLVSVQAVLHSYMIPESKLKGIEFSLPLLLGDYLVGGGLFFVSAFFKFDI